MTDDLAANDLGLSRQQVLMIRRLYAHEKATPRNWVDTALDGKLPLDGQRFYKNLEGTDNRSANNNYKAGLVIKSLVDLGLAQASNRAVRVFFVDDSAWIVRLTERGVVTAKMMGIVPETAA